ncbi:radical SAM protein [Polyangium sp. y55x31]|uniref:radical SAM/SPASM domain-containing protein n=1 Tax=Polyangium sp. y55x31 TaxID=3042688 RepID=UPI0024828B43|nr:radical SAM protein [Polyangium sp. y55x31]MDI1484206.1 radical SAM protein [Polyangium sp. y55x31]
MAEPAIPETTPAPRARRPEDGDAPIPLFAVWELTMKCDQPCQHCGSRAGHARSAELSTNEVLDVADSLARLGCREVVLIGGEAYLREDIHAVVGRLAGHGLRVVMQTGGRAMTVERARKLRDAGLTVLGVSVDGTAPIHDELRGNRGSHAAAMRALDAGAAAGLLLTANTQINRLNMGVLREIAAEIRARGALAWQVQLTVPMGRAADRPEWIVEPWHVVPIIDTLASIQREAAIEGQGKGWIFDVVAGNNLGYYGPHEALLRSRPGGQEAYWSGCRAGISGIGIESDGTVKGCPSLPTAPYAGGNVRALSLDAIWQHGEAIGFARERTEDELWGFCRTCYFAPYCRAGCSWTTHCTLGRRGNNPFCYHRVKELEKRGVRERIEKRRNAPQEPYDFGLFELVEEPLGAETASPTAGDAPRRRLPIASD